MKSIVLITLMLALAACAARAADAPPCPPGMAYIAPGAFEMGCTGADPDCRGDEKPSEHIAIQAAFCMDKYEVTQYAFDTILGVNPAFFKHCGWNCPVEQVAWDEARLFCELTGKRLPTGAEWEFAARGAQATRFFWGDTPDPHYAWYFGNSLAGYEGAVRKRGTHPVGGLDANGFGLFDMAGNVAEWVDDCQAESTPARYPSARTFDCSLRIARGGSWSSPAPELRVSARAVFDSGLRYDTVGFRCVAPPMPAGAAD